jgi:hypothetical protein
MESAENVRNQIILAEAEMLNDMKKLEAMQLSIYEELLSVLTTEIFFQPLLTSKAKEIVGRFCLKSNLSIHAYFESPPCFTIGPGVFKIQFISSGRDVSQKYDLNLCTTLILALAPSVKTYVKTTVEKLGWKCWWTTTYFCFQPSDEFEKIQEAKLLGSLFTFVPTVESDAPAHLAKLTRDEVHSV